MGFVVYLRILISFLLLLTAIFDYNFSDTNKFSLYDENSKRNARIVIITMSALVLMLEGYELLYPPTASYVSHLKKQNKL